MDDDTETGREDRPEGTSDRPERGVDRPVAHDATDRPADPSGLPDAVREDPDRVRADPDLLADYLRTGDVETTLHALRACDELTRLDPTALQSLLGDVTDAIDREIDREFGRTELITNRPDQSRAAVRHGTHALDRLADARPRSVADAVPLLDRVVAEAEESAVREPAVAAIARVGTHDPQAVVQVADTLTAAAADLAGEWSPEVGIRRAVVTALASLSAVAPGVVTDAVDPLATLVEADDLEVRTAAIACLEGVSAEYPAAPAPAAPALVAVLEEYVRKDGVVREAGPVEEAARAVYRLAKARPAALVPEVSVLVEVLRTARHREDDTLVSATVVTCAHVSREAPAAFESVAPVVAPLVAATPVDVRNRAAVEVLDNLAAVAPDAVVPVSIPLESPVTDHAELFGRALEVLARATDHDPGALRRTDLPAVLAALRSDDPDVAGAAAGVLANVAAVSPASVRRATPADLPAVGVHDVHSDPGGATADRGGSDPGGATGDRRGSDLEAGTADRDAVDEFPSEDGDAGASAGDGDAPDAGAGVGDLPVDLDDVDELVDGTDREEGPAVAEELLVAALDRSDPRVRARAARALANLAEAFPESDVYDPVVGPGLGDVVASLDDDAPGASRHAAAVLAAVRVRDPGVVDVARERLASLLVGDVDRDTRRVAVRALRNLGEQFPGDAPAVAETLVEPVAEYGRGARRTVAAALADLADSAPRAVAPVVPALVGTLSGGSITLASPVGDCIAAVAERDPAAVAEPVGTLGRLLEDGTEDDRAVAARTIARVAESAPAALGPAVGALVRTARESDLREPLAPFGVASASQPPGELLAAVAADPMDAESVAGYAVRSLAALGVADADPVAGAIEEVVGLLDADSVAARTFGVVLVGHVGRDHPGAVEDNLDALRSLLDADELSLRWYVARIVSLAAEDSPRAVKRVVHELVEDLQGSGVAAEGDVDPNYLIREDTERAERVLTWLAEVGRRSPSAVVPAVDVLVRILDGVAGPLAAAEDPIVPGVVEPATRSLAAVARGHPETLTGAVEVLAALVRFEDPDVRVPAARALAAVARADPAAVVPVAGHLATLVDAERMDRLSEVAPADGPRVSRDGVAFAASRNEETFENPYRDWKESRHVYDLATETPWLLRVEPGQAHAYYLFYGEADAGHGGYDERLEGDLVVTGRDLEGVDRVTVTASRAPHAGSQSYRRHTIQYQYGLRIVEYGTGPDHPHRPPDGPPHVVANVPFEAVRAVLEALVALATAPELDVDPVADADDGVAAGIGLLVRCRVDRVRRLALEVLARTRPSPAAARSAAAYLADRIGEFPGGLRAPAAAALANLAVAGDRGALRAAVDPLVDHLRADAPDLRRNVAAFFRRVAGEDPGAVAPAGGDLVRALSALVDEDPDAGDAVAETLGHLARSDPDVLAPAVDALPEVTGAGSPHPAGGGSPWTCLGSAGQQAVGAVLVNLLEVPAVPDDRPLEHLAAILGSDADPVARWQAAAGVRAAVERRSSVDPDLAAPLGRACLAACRVEADDPGTATDCLASVPVPGGDRLVEDVRADAVAVLERIADEGHRLAGDAAALARPVAAEADPTPRDDGFRPRLLAVLEAVADDDPERLAPVADPLAEFARTTPRHRDRAEALLDRVPDG